MSKTLVYCLRCKSKTETENPCEKVCEKENSRSVLLQGSCSGCGGKKSKLLSSKKLNNVKKEVAVKEDVKVVEAVKEHIVEKPKRVRKSKKILKEE